MEHPPHEGERGEIAITTENLLNVKRQIARTRHRGIVPHQANRLPVGDNGPQEVIAQVQEFLRKARGAASRIGQSPTVQSRKGRVEGHFVGDDDNGELFD